MEQRLYVQVVMLCQKDLNITEGNKGKNEDKFKFQIQSARSQCGFDIDFDWIEEMFSTCEHDFYKKLFQRHDETQDKSTFKKFAVPILRVKNRVGMKFHIDAPILKYC